VISDRLKRVRSYPFLQEVVVGDIALLEPSEIVPVDGIFISGHYIKCDESSPTGESDANERTLYDDVFQIIAMQSFKVRTQASDILTIS
jgi:P-type E1-E2 ATPase